eukprot:1159183-Pelagomonas_calceolata.AAC.2
MRESLLQLAWMYGIAAEMSECLLIRSQADGVGSQKLLNSMSMNTLCARCSERCLQKCSSSCAHMKMAKGQVGGLLHHLHTSSHKIVLSWRGFMACNGLCISLLGRGSRALTPGLSKVYKHLSLEDRRNWDTRYASVFHAVSCVYFAYRLLWEGDLFWKVGHASALQP